jgi:hypothetical protein
MIFVYTQNVNWKANVLYFSLSLTLSLSLSLSLFLSVSLSVSLSLSLSLSLFTVYQLGDPQYCLTQQHNHPAAAAAAVKSLSLVQFSQCLPTVHCSKLTLHHICKYLGVHSCSIIFFWCGLLLWFFFLFFYFLLLLLLLLLPSFLPSFFVTLQRTSDSRQPLVTADQE